MIRLSCASLSFDGFDDTDFVATFSNAATVGFRVIEFNCWYPRTLTPLKMKDLAERCRQTGVEPGSLHVSEFGGVSHHDISKDVCHKIRAIEAAKELGCRLVCCTGAPRNTEGGLDTVITVLREVLPVAKEKGIHFSLENHAGSNLEGIEDYKQIFETLPDSNLGVCVDTGHFEAAGISVWDVIDELGHSITHIHLKENAHFGEKTFVRFGEGETPNEEFVSKMVEHGYSGDLVVEVSPEIGATDGRPFTLDDLRKPYGIFERYEHE